MSVTHTELSQGVITRFSVKGQTLLGVAPSHSTLSRVRVLVFNRFQIDSFGVTFERRDTEFSYLVYTKAKLSKTQTELLRAFFQGVVDTTKTYLT